ncbi:MAG TPA: F0F1 ATP synthase subunit epsilon [Syntrophomonadaceae bacterium]|nr:F0F1 ATP synthase subunit epsilon [Syntrophomonadaceae bacterium]
MSEKAFMLEVVTPEQILLKDEAEFVVVPAIEGELGVLYNHAPLVAALDIGVMRYRDDSGNQKFMALGGGFMEVVDNTARILAETAETGEEIDVLRAKESKERAEKRLAERDENVNFLRAQLSLQRAMARIKTVDFTNQ